MKNKSLITSFTLIIVLALTLSYAQNTSKTEDTNKKQVKIYAEDSDIPYGDTNKIITLKENVKINHEDIEVKSDYVEYNKKKNIANSPGKIFVTSDDFNIEADKGTGDFDNKICKAQNNVKALLKRSFISKIENKDKRSDVEKEITDDIRITSDYAELDYKNKIITAKGNVIIKEKNRTINADNVKYNINTEIFYLNGNVTGIDENNQTFSSQGEVVISIKDGNEYIKAPQAVFSFFVDTEEE